MEISATVQRVVSEPRVAVMQAITGLLGEMGTHSPEDVYQNETFDNIT